MQILFKLNKTSSIQPADYHAGANQVIRNVSVAFKFYNSVRWNNKAIEGISALNYTHFELTISASDGSTSVFIETLFSHLYHERVIPIYQENRGFSAAANEGIRESNDISPVHNEVKF